MFIARDAGTLRSVVDDIHEISIIVGVDGGREDHARHAEVAHVGGHESRTDGTVGRKGVGFDMDERVQGFKKFKGFKRFKG